jgi:23S rRNA (pseudouridine1915-N3)-methyltransferase
LRVGIIAIGRMKQGPERELVARYLDRAQAGGKSLGLSGFAVTELSESRAAAAASRKLEEARAIRDLLPGGTMLIALDERGTAMGSEAFAKTLGTWREGGRGAVTFLIGGADGIDPELLKSAELTLSFSPLTWPHQLVRIMLAEQLYRATTILSGHPYHRA